MENLKLKATFDRFTRNGGIAYRVSSFSRDAKTAEAEMQFFYENYTLSGENLAPNTYYDNSGQPPYDEANISYEENTRNGKSYFNVRPSLELIREASLNSIANRGNQRRQSTRRVEIEESQDDPNLD